MIKLNWEIRSTQNWKAPDRVLTLFRKGNKHRQVQNPPRTSWGTVLYTKQEASLSELSDQLSLSPATGSVMCSCRGSRGHGVSSSLHGPLRWGFGCLGPGVVSRGGPCEKRPEHQGGHLPASQGEPIPCGLSRSFPAQKGHCPQSPVHLAPQTARGIDGSIIFLMCFSAQTSQG